MKTHFKKTLITIAIFIFSVAFLSALPAATGFALEACSANQNAEVCRATKESLTTDVLGPVISILLYVAGTIAVIMIIIGAIRYITSDGDASKAATAKNTIIYAVIGLVIAVMSFGIVTFVVGRL